MHPNCDFNEILLKYVEYLVSEQISYKVIINVKSILFLEYGNINIG